MKDEWLLIETAPKNGTKILVISNGEMHVARWKPQLKPHHDKEGWFSQHFRLYPKHWMHLPRKPKENVIDGENWAEAMFSPTLIKDR